MTILDTSVGDLAIDYSHALNGWCVYEVFNGTSMLRRSHALPKREDADGLRARWAQDRERGIVPDFQVI